MGKVIQFRRTAQKVNAPAERDQSQGIRERETESRLQFLNSIYGEQVKQMSEKERSN